MSEDTQPTTELEPEVAPEAAEEDFDDFIVEDEELEVPGRFITIRPTTGSPIYVPLEDGEESISLKNAILRTGLTFTTATQFYVGENLVGGDMPLAENAVVTAVGSVKGG